MTEETLTDRIKTLEALKNVQAAEVAAKFYCEARSHLRAGKAELAARKAAAAENVLAGGGE